MGTGVAPSLWPPVNTNTGYKFYIPKQTLIFRSGYLPVFFISLKVDFVIMSGVGNSLGEKLEKSTIIDLLTVIVLGYVSFVLYNNLGYNKSDVFTLAADQNVLALQLSVFLIAIYALELIYDRLTGSSSSHI